MKSGNVKQGLLLAGVYAMACWGLWHLSVDQFFLPAGLRVAALIVVPPRLWPYLLLGEYAYFARLRGPMVDTHGLAWAVAGSAVLMPAVMAVVHLHRRMIATRNELWLPSVAALASAVTCVLKLLSIHLLWPTPPDTPVLHQATVYLIGDFTAILTLAPLALLWMRRTGTARSRRIAPRSAAAACILLGMGLAAALLPANLAQLRGGLLLLMALPAIALTVLHGWRGAAIAVPFWSIVTALSMHSTGLPGSFDASTYAWQQHLSLYGVALLSLGASLSYYHRQYRTRTRSEQQVLAQSRAALHASEVALRHRAQQMRRVGEGIDLSHAQMVQWLRAHGHSRLADSLLHTAEVCSRQFRAQTSMVYPAALEQIGLYLALQTSGIGQEWERSYRVLPPRFGGDPCRLSVDLQLAAYRTLTDAVSLLLEHEPGQLRVRVRCGQQRQMQGLVMTLRLLDPAQTISTATTVLAIERLSARIRACGGRIECRGRCIRVVLQEPVRVPAMSSHEYQNRFKAVSHTRD
ncbi:MASE1 domain-containing protein [Stenotrophomonas oahuensis]|uniref:MASE1 domain-containing protein n=1 Tax=Stenotrophomonas oahuensis TaxID=3003271 RepID=A0ABY9YKV5_9GAMM|nr:MASE1 domain-containing protein [Stenotrophomonas sp. A5586]WNH51514.1 MASE1 domain-containing protein [Stenotrophomonas sp. A5586]